MSIALLALAAAAGTPEPIICADRPGKASQTCTVPQGHVQIETSIGDWTLTKSGGERDTTLGLGAFAIKYGLTERSQIEVNVTPWQRVTSRTGGVRESKSGFGDIFVAYKYLLTSADASLQVAASPFAKLPTAKRPIGNRRWEGGLVVPVQYSIPKTPLVVTLTPELDWVADADRHGHHALAANVANLAWQATRTLNLSAEIWSQWDWDPSGTVRQATADAAVAYLASNRVQLDAGANFGLNRASPDVEVYAGVAVLF